MWAFFSEPVPLWLAMLIGAVGAPVSQLAGKCTQRLVLMLVRRLRRRP